MSNSGEIRVTATGPEGERWKEPRTLRVEAERIGQVISLECGLRQSWAEGENPNNGMTFEASVGAGLGSPWLLVTMQYPGEERETYRIHVSEIVQAVEREEERRREVDRLHKLQETYP